MIHSSMQPFMQRAVELALHNVQTGSGGPFGAIIVRGQTILAEAGNTVTSSNDPTAHAEVNAIRIACAVLQNCHLPDCVLYASCEPCPMCLGAIYWTRLSAVFYAATRTDAAAAGFSDDLIYKELGKSPNNRRIPMTVLPVPEATAPFDAWSRSALRRPY